MNRRPYLSVGMFLLTTFLAAPGFTAGAAAQDKPFLTGQLLVAAPEMVDPQFAETVVYLIEHTEEGAFGLVINRPMAKGPIADLLKGLGEKDEGILGEVVLYYGGPIEPAQGFVLHTDEYSGERTIAMGNGISVTDDIGILRSIAGGKGPRQSIVTLGYAGWAPGQLEAEIEGGTWSTITAEKELIFDSDDDAKWDRARTRVKIRS